MDPDATLDWLLRLKTALDAEAEAGNDPDPRALYALLGLVEALDEWLSSGRRPPRKWLRAFDRGVFETSRSLLERTSPPHNDARPPSQPPIPPPAPARASPPRGRRRARRTPLEGQLALPFTHATG